jgi:hypothetical protein
VKQELQLADGGFANQGIAVGARGEQCVLGSFKMVWVGAHEGGTCNKANLRIVVMHRPNNPRRRGRPKLHQRLRGFLAGRRIGVAQFA